MNSVVALLSGLVFGETWAHHSNVPWLHACQRCTANDVLTNLIGPLWIFKTNSSQGHHVLHKFLLKQSVWNYWNNIGQFPIKCTGWTNKSSASFLIAKSVEPGSKFCFSWVVYWLPCLTAELHFVGQINKRWHSPAFTWWVNVFHTSESFEWGANFLKLVSDFPLLVSRKM